MLLKKVLVKYNTGQIIFKRNFVQKTGFYFLDKIQKRDILFQN